MTDTSKQLLQFPEGLVSEEERAKRALVGASGEYDFADSFGREFDLGWVGETLIRQRAKRLAYESLGVDADETPYSWKDDPQNVGYEQYMVGIESPYDAFVERYMVDSNEIIKSELGYQDSWVAGFAAEATNPLNYIPIPVARSGAGLLKTIGATVGAGGASEVMRYNLDPTMTGEELAANMAMETMFAGVLTGGAYAGRNLGQYFGDAAEKVSKGFKKTAEAVKQRATGKKSPQESAVDYDESFISGELRPEQPIKHNDIDTVVEKYTQDFPDGLPVVFGKNKDNALAANTIDELGNRVIKFDIDQIRHDYDNGLRYMRGLMDSPTSIQKGVVFQEFSHDRMKEWFDANGGFRKYFEFLLRHERSHQVNDDIEKYIAGQPLHPNNIYMERRANNDAFKQIGADPEQFRVKKISPDLAEGHRKAGEDLAAHLKTIETRKSQIKALDGELKELIAKREKTSSKGWKTQHQKKIDEIDAKKAMQQLDIERMEDAIPYFRNNIDHAIDAIQRANPDLDPERLSFKETGLGIEKSRWSQTPLYRIVNNKLDKWDSDLSGRLKRAAFRITASPSLSIKGNGEGVPMPISVEANALVWNGDLRQALTDIDHIYMNYAKGIDATEKQAISEKFAQNMPVFGRSLTDKMSYNEFYDSVGQTIMTGERSNIPHVAEAAEKVRELLDKMGDAAVEAGVFQSLARANREAQRAKGLAKEVREASLRGDTHKSGLSIEEADLRVQEAQDSYDRLRAMDTKEDYYPHMFDQDKLDDPAIMERLEEKIRAHFRENNTIYKDGKLISLATDPVSVEARVRETIASFHRNAAFNDVIGVIKKGDEGRHLQNRIDSIRDKQKTAKGTELEVLKKQEEILVSRLREEKGSGVGGSSRLLSRKLNIPTRELSEVLVSDVQTVLMRYVQQMAPVIEMSKEFGDLSLRGYLKEFDSHIDGLLKKYPQDSEEILKEAKKMKTDIENLRDRVLGTYGLPDNPDALHVRALETAKAINLLAYMGKPAMAALADSGRVVMAEGFKNFATGAIHAISTRGERGKESEWFIAGNEVKMAGEVVDTIIGTRMQRMTGLDGGYRNRSWLGKWYQKKKQSFFVLNLLSPWTDVMRSYAGSWIQSRLIEHSIKWSKGKLDKRFIIEMERIGVYKELADRFARQWTEAGSHKGEMLHLANTSEWTDLDAVQKFRAILGAEARNSVVGTGDADRMNMMYGPLGSTIFMYRSFGMSTTQKILMAGLQRRDADVISGIMSMIAIAFIVEYAKKPDYIEMTMDEMIYRAVERSGAMGIFADINGALEVATAGEFGVRPMMGKENIMSDPNWAERLGSITGPVASQWLRLIHAVTDPSASAADQARAARYMLPYNNLIYFDGTFRRAQRTLQEQLEE